MNGCWGHTMRGINILESSITPMVLDKGAGVKKYKIETYTHSGCGSLSTRKRTPVKVVLPAALNTRCWVNSLAHLYWVRPSLLSSSLFSVLFWASDVAILSSRSMLMLCSEVVPLRAQHIMTSSQLSTLPLVDPWCRDTPAAPQVQTQAACHRARPVGHHTM